VKDKSFYKKVVAISLPIAGQQLITVGVNMMDTLMLGQVGEVAMSASAMATQVHTLFQIMCMGMGMGASVLISRYWGANEEKSLRKALALMYRFCLVISLLYTAVVGLVPAAIMRLLTPEEIVIQEGVRYLKWALPCFFLHGFSLVTTIVFRNIKKMHIPFRTSCVAFFVNIFFNWVFIFGKLGAPAMGVAGAALGTLISRAVEFSLNCGMFFFGEKDVPFRIRDIFAPCRDLLPEYIRISLPVLISDTLLGLGSSMVASVAGHIGTAFMSANSITTVVQQIGTIFTSGLGQSAVIITGNTLGEGDAEKAQRQGITFTILGYLVGAVCCVIILLAGPFIVSGYKLTPETREVALQLMDAVAVTMIFIAPASILTKGILRGGGDTHFLMVADVIFLWLVSVPLGYLSGIVWKWPAFWVFIFLKAEHVLKATLCIFRLVSKKWIKKIKAVS